MSTSPRSTSRRTASWACETGENVFARTGVVWHRRILHWLTRLVLDASNIQHYTMKRVFGLSLFHLKLTRFDYDGARSLGAIGPVSPTSPFPSCRRSCDRAFPPHSICGHTPIPSRERALHDTLINHKHPACLYRKRVLAQRMFVQDSPGRMRLVRLVIPEAINCATSTDA